MHTYIAGETLVALMIQWSFQYPPSRNGKPAGQVHIWDIPWDSLGQLLVQLHRRNQS